MGLMPFLRVKHGIGSASFISLEDISTFRIGGLQKDHRNKDIVTLQVWSIGSDSPTLITLEISHKAVDAFAEILVETIEAARANSCKIICDIEELVRAAEFRVKQEVFTHV